jgi:hypothetical protein
VDWRWYKQSPSGLGWVIDAYWTQCHNLLDYRVVHDPNDAPHNQAFYAWCADFRKRLRDYEAGAGDGSVVTHQPTLDPAWFGRGQQYLSFVKR